MVHTILTITGLALGILLALAARAAWRWYHDTYIGQSGD